jgi:hypothetical protein
MGLDLHVFETIADLDKVPPIGSTHTHDTAPGDVYVVVGHAGMIDDGLSRAAVLYIRLGHPEVFVRPVEQWASMKPFSASPEN